MVPQHQLAQLNIARARFDRTDPRFQSFVDLVEPVNALADRMPGFVWRLADETGVGSTDIEAFDDPQMLVNMSVWQDFKSLEDFAFNTVHAKVMGRKAEWFGLMESQHLVLWWVPVGHIPTLDEAKTRLDTLQQSGPSATAFNFKHRFDPDGAAIQSVKPASA
jgi:hypothetical protein